MITNSQKFAVLSLFSLCITLFAWLMRGLVQVGAGWPGFVVLALALMTIGSFLTYLILDSRH